MTLLTAFWHGAQSADWRVLLLLFWLVVTSVAVIEFGRTFGPLLWTSIKTLMTSATTKVFLLGMARMFHNMWRQNSRGLAKHGILAALLVTTAGTAAFISRSYMLPDNGKIVELRDVYVVRDVGRYGYWLETSSTGKFFTTFCADYEPQFSEGMTLKVLKYEDRGMCWSVKNTHPAYLIVRDENGQPVRR